MANKREEERRDPLFIAAEEGDLNKIRELLNTTDVNLRSSFKRDVKRSALHVAVEVGHTDIVRYLLEQGAEIGIRDGTGATPLHTAIEYCHTEIVSLLIEQEADVNAACNIGWTPLHTAAFCGSEEIVQMLVDRGALVSPKNHTGWTPLHTAASNGFEKIVVILLTNGATDRESAAKMAHQRGFTRIAQILRNTD